MGWVYDATAWTGAHDAWLRRRRFQSGPLAIVFDECYGLISVGAVLSVFAVVQILQLPGPPGS